VSPSPPRVSVVMATRNRADPLERALSALLRQDLAEFFELVVVDDASADRTAEILARLEREDTPGVTVCTLRRAVPGGPAGARNTGWRAASGELIAFTDDDCEPEPDWLAQLAAAASTGGDAVLQGPTVPHPDQLDRISPFTRTLDVSSLGPWFPACNIAYPRQLLERLGGFDEGFIRGEDTDLAWRARAVGARFAWVPEARVRHAVVELGPIGKLRLALAWESAFGVVARHPELRGELHFGLFWKPQHAELLLAMLAVAACRRFPPAVLLALPYVRSVRARIGFERGRPLHAPWYAVHDAAEMVAALRGSMRNGTLVL